VVIEQMELKVSPGSMIRAKGQVTPMDLGVELKNRRLGIKGNLGPTVAGAYHLDTKAFTAALDMEGLNLSAQQDETDGNYVLSVHIDKGQFFRVNQVVIKGNDHFSSFRLKLRIKTWKSSVLFGSAKRFIQKDLDGDVKNLIAFYRKKGFADVRVAAEAIKKFAEKRVDVIFHVEEGPQYKIVFDGNHAFWDYTLKQEMTLSRDGNKNNFALRKSVRKLKQKYSQKGYPGAEY